MSAEIVSIASKLSVIEFDCRDCGKHVVSYCPSDHEPVCGICRFLQSEGATLDQDTKDHLRFGEDA